MAASRSGEVSAVTRSALNLSVAAEPDPAAVGLSVVVICFSLGWEGIGLG